MAGPEPSSSLQLNVSHELLFADTQVPDLSYPELRFLALNSFGLPSERLPPSKLGVTAVYQEAVLEYQKRLAALDPSLALGNLKLRFLGDLGDTGAKSETWMFRDEHQHLNQHLASLGMGTDFLSLAPGNHDAFPNGTFNSKMAFLFLQYLLNLEGNDRDFIENIAVREVGGRDNLLDKKAFLEFVHKFLGIKWDPVKIADSSKSDYELDGKKGEFSWNPDSKPALHQTFKDFWRQGENKDSYSALVNYAPNAGEKAEREYLFLHANKVSEQKTDIGVVPVYAITLDTIDFLTMSSRDGAIFGHMSYIQTRLVQSFIAEMKRRNPNAKFILETHYPLDDIEDGFSWSKLLNWPWNWFPPTHDFHEVLEDESVIGVVAGHSHVWNYSDLNSPGKREKLGIEGRKTPLFQYQVTSMIDNPIGAAWRRISTDGKNLIIELERIDLSWEQMLEKADPLMRDAFEKLKPHINTYVKAWQKIPGAKWKFQAHPEADLTEKVAVMLDYNQGTAFEPGRFHDQAKAKDGNILMAEQAQTTLREYMEIIRMELHRAGFGEVVDKLEGVFIEHFDNMDSYFENAIGSHLDKDPECHHKLGELSLDRHSIQFARALNELSMDIEKKTGREAIDGDDKMISEMGYGEYALKLEKMDKAEKMQAIIHLLYLLESFYRNWIERYVNAMEIRRNNGNPEEGDYIYELGNHNDLLHSKKWYRMDQTLRALGVASPSRFFRAITSAYAGEQRSQTLRIIPKSDAPKLVEIKVDLKTGQIDMTQPIEITEEEMNRRRNETPRPQGLGLAELETERRKVVEDWKRWEDHWVLSLGTRGEFKGPLDSWPTALALSGGKSWNIWLGKPSLWRLTTKATADLHTAGPNGFETGAKAALYFDVAGILALGAAFTAGWAFGDLNQSGDGQLYNGVGGRLNLFENWVEFGVDRTWYRDLEKGTSDGVTQYNLMLDPFAILRGANLIDRDW
ncbi:MAG: hypothetical protein Q7T11_06770 [Deltaproteobacteria bacterium]|nr:hypothetical protein [Deltaproteobacteria bacterium]